MDIFWQSYQAQSNRSGRMGLEFRSSLSLELGFIKLDPSGKYVMDGELRPILDKNFRICMFLLIQISDLH